RRVRDGEPPPYLPGQVGRFPLPWRDLDLVLLGAHHVVVEGGGPECRLRDRVVAIDNYLGEPASHEHLAARANSSCVLAALCRTRRCIGPYPPAEPGVGDYPRA